MRLNKGALLAGVLLAPALAFAQDGTTQQASLKDVLERLQRLEKENQALRARLDAVAPDTEKRIQALETAQQQADKALNTERLSEHEPELVTRLKAVEFQTLAMQKQARQIEALDGVSVSASLASVLQAAPAAAVAEGQRQSRLNYRGDVSIGAPAGSLGDIEGRLFAHVRLGQGQGLALRDSHAGGSNATAFQTQAGASDSFAVLAQAWYQLNIPLPRDHGQAKPREQIELTVGKMDPFLFFDQNAIADDETTRFLNKVFVHNPLLDAGGDIGGDAYGFTPGVRVAYTRKPDRTSSWSASLGLFAAGEAASFGGGLSKPLLLAQLDTSRRLWDGLPGNYRVYAWRNAQASDHDGTGAVHAGWGTSVDQRLSDSYTGFLRYGQQAKGSPRVDRALTLGMEVDGRQWGRGADGLGLALGWLHSSAAYRAAQGTGAQEQVWELYYRYQFNDKVQITPDLQWIRHPLALAGSPAIRVFGVRAKVGL